MLRLFIFCISMFCFTHVFPQENSDYCFNINSPEQFRSLAGEPLTQAFSGVSAVKIVYHIDENKLYFINSKKYRLHYNFCKDQFEDIELPDFNAQNYSNSHNRNYYLATVNHFRDLNLYTLEFSPADDISVESVGMLYQLLRKKFFDANFRLQLSSQHLLNYSSWNVPVITMDELFSGQKLQVIQKGEVTGRLVVAHADSLSFLGNVSNCILLIRGNSNDVPLCKGIITTSLQTPLSHISILAQNRKTPVIACREAATSLSHFNGQKVRFTVMQDTFFVKPDTFSTTSEKGKTSFITLKLDTSPRLIISLSKLTLKDASAYGVKAVNLAQLQKVKYRGKPIHTPEGAFAIPMIRYFNHLRQNGIDTMISRFLTHYQQLSKTTVQAELDKISQAIVQGKMNKQLVKEIEMMIASGGTSGRYRFRSSSNAEDLEGFNGAGLYTSETGSDRKSIEKAIKKVWASLWSERAFDERCFAGIDHSTVGMAILAHRSFPDELINGVAITRNLYRDFDFGFVINMQVGDHNLVKPKGDETCEQLISYFNSSDPFFNQKDAVEYITFSSLNNNMPLLNKQEIYELSQQLDRIKRRFYRRMKAWKTTPYKDFAMDVEFKAEISHGKKVFYFKQARPFR